MVCADTLLVVICMKLIRKCGKYKEKCDLERENDIFSWSFWLVDTLDGNMREDPLRNPSDIRHPAIRKAVEAFHETWKWQIGPLGSLMICIETNSVAVLDMGRPAWSVQNTSPWYHYYMKVDSHLAGTWVGHILRQCAECVFGILPIEAARSSGHLKYLIRNDYVPIGHFSYETTAEWKRKIHGDLWSDVMLTSNDLFLLDSFLRANNTPKNYAKRFPTVVRFVRHPDLAKTAYEIIYWGNRGERTLDEIRPELVHASTEAYLLHS